MKFLDCIDVNPKISLEKSKIVPFIEMGNVSTIYRNPVAVERKPFDSGVKFQDGDTVVARITPCLQNGKRFYCKNIGTGFGSTEYLVFRPKNESIDNLYLYYFMKTEFIKQSMINSMVGATGRQRVNNDVFKNIEVNFPDKEKQIKIGKILSAYDDLIENNQKQIKLLEEAAQRLYKEWFVDLRFPGYETTPIIDGVPEGWRKSFVGECAIILRRGISPAYHENGKFTVINQKCIRQTVVDFDEARKQEKAYSDDLNLLDSDTVICSTGAGTLGRVGQIFGNHPKTTFDSHITLVRANEMIGKQYLFHVLKSYQNYLMGMGKGSTNQLELSRNTIQELTVYVPTFELKIKFEALVQPIHDKISLLNKKIKYLYEARDRLLPKLMSGELEV